MLLPRFGNPGFVPIELDRRNLLQLGIVVIEIGKFRIGAVVRNPGIGAIFIAVMTRGKPLVADPQMVADAKAQAVL